MKKNKTGAMEMTVGTIVTIVLLMSALVLGLILTKTIFQKTTENVENIDTQVKGEINDLFGDEGTTFVIRLGNQNTAKVRQGTANFGIPIGFSPTDPRAWGTATPRVGCTYLISPDAGEQYCISKGWDNPCDSIKTGCGTASTGITFGTFESNNGYSLIKVDVPENVPPCLQRFTVIVKCRNQVIDGVTFRYSTTEFVQQSFDIEVLKKGIF